MTLTSRVVVGAVLVLVLVAAAAWSDRRQRRRRSASAATAILGPDTGRTPPGTSPVPRYVVALLVAVAAITLITAGYSSTSLEDQASRDRSDKAAANRQTCLSIVNTGWRKAIGVTLVGAQVTRDEAAAAKLPADLRELVARVHLPDTVAGIRAEGRRRTIAALIDDARIGDRRHEICPYTAGRPDLTPARPVDSATAHLEAQLTYERAHPTTTTTKPGG